MNHIQIDELLDDTAMLLDTLSQLEAEAGKVKKLSQSIANLLENMKPKHDRVSVDLDRMRRLQDVLRYYVFARPGEARPATLSEFGSEILSRTQDLSASSPKAAR